LDDVPDFAEPRAATRREPVTKASAGGTHASGTNAASAPANQPTPLSSHEALAQRARARDLLARLREYRGGTVAGSDQIGPFSNVVVEQLGEEQVAALTNQVWGVTPDQLTAQQMRALTQWGKTDPFSTEVEAVLDLLASERADDASGEAKGAAARTNRQAARPAGRGSGSTR
jgi:hypothetical protein